MIDQELKQRALTPAAKGEAAPREKILKLGKKITDVVDHKLGKVRTEDAEYWGLAGVVTDEMADIALTMKLRTPYTVEELWKMNKVTEEQKPHFQELLDQMSYIGLLEYDYGYQTIEMIRNAVDMYQLTVEGLGQGLKKLVSAR